MNPDYVVVGGPSVFLVEPHNPAALNHLRKSVGPDGLWLGENLAVEHRYIADLASGLQSDGFVVSMGY